MSSGYNVVAPKVWNEIDFLWLNSKPRLFPGLQLSTPEEEIMALLQKVANCRKKRRRDKYLLKTFQQ